MAAPVAQDPALGALMGFVIEADKLKSVLRQNTLADGSRRENSAEHSWHIALMAVTLARYAPPGADMSRVITMLLLHDLVEVDAGDLNVYAPDAAQRAQAVAETAAADRLFGMLPGDQGVELRALWDEFCARTSLDAKFARALDRLQPMMLNHQTRGGSWRVNAITADQVLDKVRLIEDGSAELGDYARELVGDAVRRGYLEVSGEPR